MFLTKSSDKAAQETADQMHQNGITAETPAKDLPSGFFVGTKPFRAVEAEDGRRVIPLNKYTIEGKVYYFYQRVN